MINDVTDPMFSIVKPDNPVYFYTEDPTGSQGINRIVRDGSGRLWFYMCIGGVPVDESVVKVIAPVPQYAHTWQQEREAVVAKLNRLVNSYRYVEDVDPVSVAETIRDIIADGEHWPEGGTP